MSSTSRFARTWEHATVCADSMLLVVPIGLTLVAILMNLLAAIGQAGAGFAVGVALAPAGAAALAMKLHGRAPDKTMAIDTAISTLAVAVVAGLVYTLVVARGLDRTPAMSAWMIGIMVIEGVVLLGLAADSIVDLSRRHAHGTLDKVRLIAALPLILAVAMFATNPDFGEFVVVGAPLALAGALAGLIAETLETWQHS